jgi:hypothetical protein
MATRREQLCDEKGKELRDLSAAHEHALHLIHRAMSYLAKEDTRGWMIKIATATDTAPLTVLFPPCHFATRRTDSNQSAGAAIRSRLD